MQQGTFSTKVLRLSKSRSIITKEISIKLAHLIYMFWCICLWLCDMCMHVGMCVRDISDQIISKTNDICETFSELNTLMHK